MMNVINNTSASSKSMNSHHFRRCSLFLDFLAVDDSDVNEMWENDINVFDEALPKENSDHVTNTSLNEKERTPSLTLGLDIDTLDNCDILQNEKNRRDSLVLANYITNECEDKKEREKFLEISAMEPSQRSRVPCIKSEREARELNPKKFQSARKHIEVVANKTSGTANMILPSRQYYQTVMNNLTTSMERSEKTRKEILKMKKMLKMHKNSGFLNKGNAIKRWPRC